MTDYLTRVELHGANGDDYTKLHQEMLARKFFKHIIADDGTHYELPTAEYSSKSVELSAAGVRDLAIAAAKTTGRRYWVLTVVCDNAAWFLRPM